MRSLRLLTSFRNWKAVLLAFLLSAQFAFAAAPAPPPPSPTGGDSYIYLPVVTSHKDVPRVNAPYFSGDIYLALAAISWFGRVKPSENYVDVRVGYNDQNLYVYTAAIDRRVWFDTTPSVDDLTRWDSVTLYLNTADNWGRTPDTASYRFTAQLSESVDDSRYQLSARGDGAGWADQDILFHTMPGWRGVRVNDNGDDSGWTMRFLIPFNSLGLSGPPPQGSLWKLALTLHDRDDAAGTPIADQIWPPSMNGNSPGTWGQIRFGLPVYTPPPAAPGGTVTIRHRLNGAVVKDAAAGGYSLCGGSLNYWSQWGDAPENILNPAHESFNVQNQGDVSDWPCFSKYYVAFPLNAIPAGKAVLSATLTLHEFGNAGDSGQVYPSLIQVLTVNQDWDEATLTWNNAPLAWENVSQALVDPVGSFPGWPGVPWTWDLSYAVAKAYARGGPLRLAIYSADYYQHSGKYFVSSDTGDWNAVARPTLDVTWGNP